MKFAIILSGCGVMDGSEIHESVITLMAIDKEGATYECFAPDRDQTQVIDHTTNKPLNEKRNILKEAARIARGKIKDISSLYTKDFDGVILPGGFGAACNLSSFANDGKDAVILPEIEKVLKDFYNENKPIGAICIAPNILAKVFSEKSPELTIGTDKNTAKVLEQIGAKHINKNADEILIDEKNLLVSTPAYMLATRLSELEAGITKLVRAMIKLNQKISVK